ncbi:Hypothetical protein R9X50_00684300 [Acrodontium crateriforme]|uniref:Uncharacterized protein n=1 Tax=Acrodontium crateriforme TaxID=150365 RepID=A0AAQ3RCE0_9PEZI|nr:Hypothetical protein R9X50_00684300 [Acrodontium crateriforme]
MCMWPAHSLLVPKQRSLHPQRQRNNRVSCTASQSRIQSKMSFSIATIAMIAHMVLAMPQTVTTAVQPVPATGCVSNAIGKLLATGMNGTTVLDCDSAFEIVGIESIPASGLHARCTDPQTFTLKQTQVVQSGTWWDEWAEDSGCQYCGLSDGICQTSINWADTSTATFTIGFDLSTQNSVLSLIQANSRFNFGYSWGQSFTKGGMWSCTIPPGGVTRLYIQNQKGWADSQVRYGTSTVGCGGNSVDWDAWSAYMHSNWALSGDDTVQHGCSSGADAHC